MLRKTKIIATLGPATHGRDRLRQLIERGVDVFRINMSHARHDTVREVVGIIREECAALDRSVAILIDLQGPSIRTGDLPEPYTLKVGDVVEFRNDDLIAGQPLSTTVNYDGLSDDVREGDTLLADNGVIHFKVLSKRPGRLVCEALTAGVLGSRRHINLPGVRVNLPALTKKDLLDIELAISIQADFVAISFVRDAQHVRQLRDLLGEKDCPARIVAKIEDQEAVRHMEEIVVAADAVMVARGDLGIEVHIEELPVIQRDILKTCARVGRKVIVATHMLESMIELPVPTRAEITDVANAVYEQADAVMLSGETSVGKHPLECVSVLDRISRRMEREPGAGFSQAIELTSEKQFTVKAAVVLADSLPDSHILVFTARGIMANYVAHQRPRHSHIFAFTPDPVVRRALHLNRAITPFVSEFATTPEATIRQAIEFLQARQLVAPGDPVVILSDVLTGDFDTNAVLLRKV